MRESCDREERRRNRKKSRSRSRSRSRRRHRREKKATKGKRDKDTPHFKWQRGMTLGRKGRYTVKRLMGDGTFGRVLACQDGKTKETVAVKVVKGVKRFCEHAEMEAEVLEEIQKRDTEGQSFCVRILDSFLHPKRHFCIVFEPLGCSIRDLLKASGGLGLYLADARQIAMQLLQSLSFLHGIGLTHTDLKCRNVMLRDDGFHTAAHPRIEGEETHRPHDCRIAVIDFGGAVFVDERHSGRVGTRQFRGPEVVLGLPWDESSDIWSAGCIISMLYLGQRPISVHEDMEHIAIMERLLEAEIPGGMAKEATELGLPDGVTFTSKGWLNWPHGAPDKEAVERVAAVKPLRQQILPRHRSFLELCLGLLQIDPRQRLTAAAALQRPFFAEDLVE